MILIGVIVFIISNCPLADLYPELDYDDESKFVDPWPSYKVSPSEDFHDTPFDDKSALDKTTVDAVATTTNPEFIGRLLHRVLSDRWEALSAAGLVPRGRDRAGAGAGVTLAPAPSEQTGASGEASLAVAAARAPARESRGLAARPTHSHLKGTVSLPPVVGYTDDDGGATPDVAPAQWRALPVFSERTDPPTRSRVTARAPRRSTEDPQPGHRSADAALKEYEIGDGDDGDDDDDDAVDRTTTKPSVEADSNAPDAFRRKGEAAPSTPTTAAEETKPTEEEATPNAKTEAVSSITTPAAETKSTAEEATPNAKTEAVSSTTTVAAEIKPIVEETMTKAVQGITSETTTAKPTTTATAITSTDTTSLNTTNSTTTQTTQTTPKPKLDIPALLMILMNLTYDYETNLTQLFNETLQKYGIPTCATPTTTTTTTVTTTTEAYDYVSNGTGTIAGKCFVCGLEDEGIPRNAHCSDAFAGDFIPLVPVDYTARGHLAVYRKYCRFMPVDHYHCNASEPRSLWGRWTGGCAVRWVDLSGVYTQRTCRNRYRAVRGRHFLSKRMAKLEMALQHVDNGCIISPMASLVPFSRGVSLFARFHACVCTGSWCNRAPPSPSPSPGPGTLLVVWIAQMIRERL